MKGKHWIAVVTMSCVAALVLIAAALAQGEVADSSLASQAYAGSAWDNHEVTTEQGDGGRIVQHVSAQMPGFSVDELMERSYLVVSGTVVGKSNAFVVDPSDDKEPRFFTDVFITVDEVFRGSPAYADETAKTIAVRVEGGSGEFVATVNDATPAFDEGFRYLLFLYQLDDGTYYNAQGDHYYVVGVGTGAWEDTVDGTFASPCWQPDGRDCVTAEDVIAVATSAPAEPLPSISGETEPFAHVLTNDEQRAYEQDVVNTFRNGSSVSSEVHEGEGIKMGALGRLYWERVC